MKKLIPLHTIESTFASFSHYLSGRMGSFFIHSRCMWPIYFSYLFHVCQAVYRSSFFLSSSSSSSSNATSTTAFAACFLLRLLSLSSSLPLLLLALPIDGRAQNFSLTLFTLQCELPPLPVSCVVTLLVLFYFICILSISSLQ